MTLVPLFDAAGKVVRMLGMGKDIPQHRSAAQAPRESEPYARAIVENAPVGMMITDSGGGLLFVNATFQRMLGYDEEELRRLGWIGITHPDDIARMRAQAALLMNRGPGQVVLEKRYLRKTGEILWVKLTAVPARLEQAAEPVIIAMVEDITHRKEAETTLTRAKEEAERLSLAKTRFLAAVSHDLRQPLQALILFHDILASRNRDPLLDEVIDRMGQSLAGQKTMLETLLDISKLDAGIVTAEIVDFPIRLLIRRLADEFAPVAAAAGLEFRWVESGELIRSDPLLLERILRNLLSNAIKYNVQGRVLLGCRRTAGELRVQVFDTGIGIDEQHLPIIFEEFFQVDSGMTPHRNRNGLGLGLSIVDRLARLLGHRVAVRSRPGRGSCFEVRVPLCPAPPGPASGGGSVERLDAAAERLP